MKYITFLLALFISLNGFSQKIEFLEVADGFAAPIDIEHANDDRLFILEQRGTIRILDKEYNTLPGFFLDIQDRVVAGGERGLLGIAFHPNFPESPFFYVNYTGRGDTTHVSRFQVGGDPNVADPNSEYVLLKVPQPFANHNGGDLSFGPDGYLYIGLGDGGSGSDPGNRSQNRLTLLGKMLRIDVNSGAQPYVIPDDNPFAMDDFTLDEIWSLGLRNPWRFSFDRLTGDMYIADVGQNVWEEIDYEPSGFPGGANYGWRCYEGDVSHIMNPPCADSMTFPVHTYFHSGSNGCSVTGGFVYRGFNIPSLYGKYIYGDFCSGQCWTLERNGDNDWTNEPLFDLVSSNLVTFGEDEQGELYFSYIQRGEIYKIIDDCLENPLASPELNVSGNEVSVAVDFENIFWYREGMVVDSMVNPLVVDQNGDYYAIITDSRGCQAESDTANVMLTSISEKELENWSIYPNPFQDEIQLKYHGDAHVQGIRVWNTVGALIHQANQFDGSLTIDTRSWKSGLYIMELEVNGARIILKRLKADE